MKREIYLKEIIEEFGNLKNKIELRSQLNLQDVNIISEYHIQEVLNIVYDLKLTNSNELVKNSKAIDLQDLTNSIAVQVTSTPRTSKLQETLDKFFDSNLDMDFQTLFIFILGKKQQSYKNLKIKEGFIFNPNEHIIDFFKITSKLSTLPTVKLEKIINLLREDKITHQKQESDVVIFKKRQTIRKKILKVLISSSRTTSDAIIDYYDPAYKFKYEDLIIRSIKDEAYPNFNDPKTNQRADWYKVFSFNLTENYLEVNIMYYDYIVVNEFGEWNYLGSREENDIPKNLKFVRANVVERIPLEYIIDIDLNEEDPIIFVNFKNGKAYKEQIPFIRGYYKSDNDCRRTHYFEFDKQNPNI